MISKTGRINQTIKRMGPRIETKSQTKSPKRINMILSIKPTNQVNGPPQGSKRVEARLFIEKKLGTNHKVFEYNLYQSEHAFP